MTRRQTRDRSNIQPRFQSDPAKPRELMGVALFAFAGLTLVSLLHISPGSFSDAWSSALRALFGWGAFALPLLLFWVAALLMRRSRTKPQSSGWGRVFAAEIFFTAALAFAHLVTPTEDPVTLAESGAGGGFIGWVISSTLLSLIGFTAAVWFFIAVGLFTLPAILGLSTARLREWSDALTARAEQTKRDARRIESAPKIETAPELLTPPKPPTPSANKGEVTSPLRSAKKPARPELSPTRTSERPVFGAKPTTKAAPAEPEVILTPRERLRRRVILPSIDLLDASSEARYSESDANRKAHLIEETLAHFGIPVRVIEVNAGPTITQFGLEPGFLTRRGSDGEMRQRKVSVNRIAALQHDLELALAAAPIRIETPVPGRAVVGVEVPNAQVSLVSLRGVLESETFKKKKMPLKIALGRDVSGRPISSDLAVMPHLLIAGATGSGKSVCINAIIACLLFNNSPDHSRLIMVDPKRVELTAFNGIPHLLGPVVVNMDEVVSTLRWIAREMDQRFSLFAQTGVRNIDAFNEKMSKGNGATMPYIVVLIDELADLMLVAPEETERLLTRLAQMSRATGIHLVIATQRPSVDVVTGLIKANFPSRISFAVTSSVDSRVVLDMPGAEKLLGRGDMLYMSSDSSKLLRLQGCFVSDDELARLVHFWRNQIVNGQYDIAKEPPWKGMPAPKESGDDALIDQAIEFVRQSEHTSISALQRKFGIGYPRAARLIDQLEERGVVGSAGAGGKSRTVVKEMTTQQVRPRVSKRKR